MAGDRTVSAAASGDDDVLTDITCGSCGSRDATAANVPWL